MNDYYRELLDEIDNSEEIFYDVIDHAMEKEIEVSFQELDEQERQAFVIGKYLTDVNNGGFDQYFQNSDGKYAVTTVDVLDGIEEKIFSKLLDEAARIFKAVIPDDVKIQEYDELDDRFFAVGAESYDQLYEKFVAYLRDQC